MSAAGEVGFHRCKVTAASLKHQRHAGHILRLQNYPASEQMSTCWFSIHWFFLSEEIIILLVDTK